MFEQAFAEGNSFIHRLDPRVKALFAFAFSVLVAVADRPWAMTLAIVLSAALVAAARLPARGVAYRLAVVNGFVLFLWLVLPFSHPGEAIFRIGSLAATREGVAQALLITVKSNAIILASIALLSTTHLATMGLALSRLRVPDKLIHILLFMLRYLGEIGREYLRLSVAMKMRSFRPRTDLHTYRSLANMIGMLLVSSYERAEAVYAAMLCRGFKGKFYTQDEFTMTGGEFAFTRAMTALLLLIGLLQWAGAAT